jgi:hypothetical protein
VRKAKTEPAVWNRKRKRTHTLYPRPQLYHSVTNVASSAAISHLVVVEIRIGYWALRYVAEIFQTRNAPRDANFGRSIATPANTEGSRIEHCVRELLCPGGRRTLDLRIRARRLA